MQQSRSQRAALYCRPTLDHPDCKPQCGDLLAHAAPCRHGMFQESRAEADDACAARPVLAVELRGLPTTALKYGVLSPAASTEAAAFLDAAGGAGQ